MKPFLKWAGNKYPIIDRIRRILPSGGRLIEPFAGSAAVFLNTGYASALLSDANADLISLYRYLQAEGDGFIAYCETFFTPENNTPEAYYAFRSEFNTTGDQRKKAALFLYFNRHGYNGLCRYNNSGLFNVPFGRYGRPYFPKAEMRFFAEKAETAVFACGDFAAAMRQAKPGDVVYCDPPYVPLSATANFTGYSGGGFGLNEQAQLAELAEELSGRRIPVVISNHDTPFTKAAYRSAKIYPFEVQRYISCRGDNRNKAGEVLALFASR